MIVSVPPSGIASSAFLTQIEEHLRQLRFVAAHVGQAGIDLQAHGDVAARQLGLHQRQHLVDDLVHVERRQARLRRRAEREQLLDEAAQPIDLAGHHAGVLADLGLVAEALAPAAAPRP